MVSLRFEKRPPTSRVMRHSLANANVSRIEKSAPRIERNRLMKLVESNGPKVRSLRLVGEAPDPLAQDQRTSLRVLRKQVQLILLLH